MEEAVGNFGPVQLWRVLRPKPGALVAVEKHICSQQVAIKTYHAACPGLPGDCMCGAVRCSGMQLVLWCSVCKSNPLGV